MKLPPKDVLPDIEDLERAMSLSTVRPATPRPSSFGVHRLVLHAFSGRRRPGDFQEFIEAMLAKCSGIVVHIVSVDIILNSVWGDVTSEAYQRNLEQSP